MLTCSQERGQGDHAMFSRQGRPLRWQSYWGSWPSLDTASVFSLSGLSLVNFSSAGLVVRVLFCSDVLNMNPAVLRNLRNLLERLGVVSGLLCQS